MDFMKCSHTSIMRNQKEKDKIQVCKENKLTENSLVFTGSLRKYRPAFICLFEETINLLNNRNSNCFFMFGWVLEVFCLFVSLKHLMLFRI